MYRVCIRYVLLFLHAPGVGCCMRTRGGHAQVSGPRSVYVVRNYPICWLKRENNFSLSLRVVQPDVTTAVRCFFSFTCFESLSDEPSSPHSDRSLFTVHWFARASSLGPGLPALHLSTSARRLGSCWRPRTRRAPSAAPPRAAPSARTCSRVRAPCRPPGCPRAPRGACRPTAP